tara:strand:- start:941 stop:1123 length:183 start_codon:yes stop_codon:yes gene_type:complete
MLEISLVNERPSLTPMESNRENLEVLITMLMLSQQISESDEHTAESMVIVSAALNNPAEA